MAIEPVAQFRMDSLGVRIFSDRDALGSAAAGILRAAAEKTGEANLLAASGNSQIAFLSALRSRTDIPWPQVNIFHLDEYIGIGLQHPARFANFLRRELLDHVAPRAFFPVWDGIAPLEEACRRYAELLRSHPADVCALGFGENGHLAFNDPPAADFHDPVRVKSVELAEASRRQQVGEGHFARLEDVPARALTLTIPALLEARRILAIVPEARKAEAVRRALLGPIQPACPASILRTCPHAALFLDRDSAAGIRP